MRDEARDAERTVFEHVCWELWGNVFHQGSVWQVSARTVPFFVEILVDGPPRSELRQFALSYLAHLAIGYPQDFFPDSIDPGIEFQLPKDMRTTALDITRSTGFRPSSSTTSTTRSSERFRSCEPSTGAKRRTTT